MKNSESRRNYYGLPKLLSRWSRQHGRRLFQQTASDRGYRVYAERICTSAGHGAASTAGCHGAAAPPLRVFPRRRVPNYTQPFVMRPGDRDFSKPHQAFPNFLKTWEPISVDGAGDHQFPASGCAWCTMARFI